MKTCFQITECNFASAKILQKSEITKRFATFFYYPSFFLVKSKYSSYIYRMKKRTKRKKEVVQKGGLENRKVDQKQEISFATYRQQQE